MKKKLEIFIMMLIIFMVTSERLLAPPYSVVVVDPGHGGPGAWKYGPNGDDHGTCGPVLKLSEQWVNLQVGLELKDLITYMGGVGFPVIMTRWTEQAENLHWEFGYDYTMWERAGIANYGHDGTGYPVTQYISVHHNYPLSKQGTEVWWCSNYKTDHDTNRVHGYWRPAYMDSLLAMKTQFRLLDLWGYDDRCLTQCAPGSGSSFCCNKDYFVLRNTIMPSAISEASSLADSIQELLFDNPNTGHADSEAVALYDGWYSHADNDGIAIIRNSYSLGGEGKVVIAEWPCDGGDTVSSPYVRCWLMGEHHCLVAITPQIIQEYQYSFHHWTHLDRFGTHIGDDWYEPQWYITVPADLDYHRYVAYFTGGPYSAQVVSPNGWEIWQVGEQRNITWNVSIGADSTTTVYIYLDRNGGNSGYPEYLGARQAKYGNSFAWIVTGPYSTHCRIKVLAEDVAGNSAWDVSDYDFTISASGNNNPIVDGHLQCKYPQAECEECFHYGESRTIEIDAHDPDGDSLFYEWYCGPSPFGGHFSNGQNHIITPQNYVVYTAPAKLKALSSALRPCDKLRVLSEVEAQAQGGDSSTSLTVPEQGPREQSRTTEGGDGERSSSSDYISVGVTDVRGGQSWTEGWFDLFDPGHSCRCGDVNWDTVINVGDVCYLLTYLFKGGYPHPDPIMGGDVNNDCIIDVGDIIYLLDFLFSHASPPECCWIY